VDTVGKKPPVPAAPVEGMSPSLAPEALALATLQARASAMEEALGELHNQRLASSELIKTLADQNAQLIQRIEVNRVRLLWLAGVTVLVAVTAVAGLALAFVR
jgi:two-component sensor histidine kinase